MLQIDLKASKEAAKHYRVYSIDAELLIEPDQKFWFRAEQTKNRKMFFRWSRIRGEKLQNRHKLGWLFLN